MDIVIVGSINADLTVRVARHPGRGETLLGSGGGITAGGKGANQAVAAALQGGSVAMIGAVGNDAHAGPATAYLHSAKVDMSGVAVVDETTGLAVITVADDGENTIIVVPGANAAVTAEFVEERAPLIESAELLLLQGEIPADGFTAAVRLATGRVVVTLAPVIEVDRRALISADPLIANEHEAGLILDQLGAGISADDPEALVTALLHVGFRSVILTLGGRGALVGETDGITHIPTPQVTPVDTVGAGDAFTGAVAARLTAGENLIDAAHHAARVGAYATTGHGAQSPYPGPGAVLP
ncbi:ribokinase [Corynebacterium hylobatis]|uniref:Ribokinase n=1 Tax=Corynebacterium hylobatis TaxID=1859290 RepID=A0A430HXH2_9CORY|nr:ribokinase [Corynebacterium hylobatis]RSZ62442.1 ribokinase [Corynebacterium hylobatis]